MYGPVSLRQLFARRTASTLRECSSTNTTNVLPTWWSSAWFQSGRKAASESWIPKSMDWSWWCTELATMVTGSEPIRLPCVGLHESYGVFTQGEHERTTPANSQCCKKHQQRCSASFSGHTSQKMHPSRRRILWTTCLSGERQICNCTFNNISQ